MNIANTALKFLQWLLLFLVALLAAVIGRAVLVSVGNSPIAFRLDIVHIAAMAVLLVTLLRAAADDNYYQALAGTVGRVFRAGGGIWLVLAVWAALSLMWAVYPIWAGGGAFLLFVEICLGFVIAAAVSRGGLFAAGAVLLLATLPHIGLAAAQTINSGDLGLAWLGEWAFDPADPYGFGPQSFRAYALAFHPNVLAGYFSIALMIGVALVYETRYRRGLMAGLLVIVGLLLVGLLLTVSRTAIAITLVVMLPAAFFAFRPRGRALWLTLGVIALGVVGLGVLSVTTPVAGQVIQRFRELTMDTSGLINRVLYAFPNTWDLFTQHPVRGVGIENLQLRLRDMQPDQHGMLLPAHNVYVMVMAELGIIGGVLYAAGLWFPIRGLFSTDRRVFLLAASLVAFSLIIVFDFYFWGFRPVRPLTFWLLGMIWGLQIQQPQAVTDETIGTRTQPLNPSASGT